MCDGILLMDPTHRVLLTLYLARAYLKKSGITFATCDVNIAFSIAKIVPSGYFNFWASLREKFYALMVG